jgi:hypothetical protein
MSEKRYPVSDPFISIGAYEQASIELKKGMNEFELKKNPLDMVASS